MPEGGLDPSSEAGEELGNFFLRSSAQNAWRLSPPDLAFSDSQVSELERAHQSFIALLILSGFRHVRSCIRLSNG